MTLEDFSLIIQYMKISDDDCCLSGGALGSDRKWGELADKYNQECLHFSFEDHTYHGHVKNHQVIVPEAFLDASNPPLKAAASKINKRFNTNATGYVANLLRRNYYQIAYSTSVYAVTTFNKHTGVPEGGTAWAVQMYIDRCEREAPMNECKCYILDKATNKWFQWKGTWEQIPQPPTPSGMWTGIGSRKIDESNVEAMEALWKTDISRMRE